MSSIWKALLVAALLVPLTAYVASSLVPLDSGDDDRGRPVIIGEQRPETSDPPEQPSEGAGSTTPHAGAVQQDGGRPARARPGHDDRDPDDHDDDGGGEGDDGDDPSGHGRHLRSGEGSDDGGGDGGDDDRSDGDRGDDGGDDRVDEDDDGAGD